MNLNNFRIKTTLACLAIFAGTVIPASPTFAQNILANAVYGGNDTDGTPMYVCAGIANNAVYPGKRRSDEESHTIGRKIPNQSSQCSNLCQELQAATDQVDNASGQNERKSLLIELRKIQNQVRLHHCSCNLQ